MQEGIGETSAGTGIEMVDNGTSHWTDDDDLVSRFVLHQLPQAEEEQLSSHLSTCEQCQRAVKEETLFAARMKLAGRSALKERLKSRLSREKERVPAFLPGMPSHSRIPWMRIASVAAVAVIIVVVGVYNNWFFSDFRSSRPVTGEIEKEQPKGLDEAKNAPSAGSQQAAEAARAPELRQASKPAPPPLAARRQEVRLDQKAGGKEQHVAPMEEPPVRQEAIAGAHAEKQEVQLMDHIAINEPQTYWVEGQVLSSPTQIYTQAQSPQGQTGEALSKTTDMYARAKKDVREGAVPSKSTIPIALQQRPVSAIPSSAGVSRDRPGTIQTMVELLDHRIRLTLFLDPLMSDSALQTAEVTFVNNDYVVLRFPDRSIGLTLPPDLLQKVNSNTGEVK